MQKPQTDVFTQKISSPLGEMTAYATDQGLCILTFADQEKSAKIVQQALQSLHATLIFDNNPPLVQARQELSEYFSGIRQTFHTPLHILGTDFQQRTWQTLHTISYGQTLSYGEQARRMHQASSVRAVANANGRNRIAIIIPCHRVIGSDGSLTGYGGGLHRKQWLLDFEQTHSKS